MRRKGVTNDYKVDETKRTISPKKKRSIIKRSVVLNRQLSCEKLGGLSDHTEGGATKLGQGKNLKSLVANLH